MNNTKHPLRVRGRALQALTHAQKGLRPALLSGVAVPMERARWYAGSQAPRWPSALEHDCYVCVLVYAWSFLDVYFLVYVFILSLLQSIIYEGFKLHLSYQSLHFPD